MKFDDAVRDALRDLADDAPPGDGLARTALRQARRRRARTWVTTTVGVAGVAVAAVPVSASMLSELENSNAVPTGANASSEPANTEPAVEPSPTRQESEQQESEQQDSEQQDSDVVPAPDSRLLTDDELTEAFASCQVDVLGERVPGYDGWEPVFGVTLDVDAAPGTPTMWVAARRGDDYRADCALNASGEMIGGGGEYGAKSTPTLLYAVVDGQGGMGSGRFVEPVARITVQLEDGPEQEAVLHKGFWFYPEIDTASAWFSELDDEEQMEADVFPDWDLIGIPLGYTFRGYDDEGQLVYDSTVDGPSVEDCYADPTGTEFVGNHAGRTDPAECVRTHVWEPVP
ncbi:MAG TPA: hypothetical protein VFZ37_07760 [Jiangellaceae bacterium]